MQQLGRYTLHNLLGKGGAATVHEAELNGPAGFRKRVALKIVRNMLDEANQQDLVNEARLGALLRHANVVDIYELGEEEGRVYIAMELVNGPTMKQLVEQHGPPPAEVALELCRQITRGLIHAHALQVDGRPANLIHRDLKPSNILIDLSGLAKISDFGIASAEAITDSQSETDFVRGTLGYMAPEQFEGHALDQRADVFALGAVFYFILTGRRLIESKSVSHYVVRLLDMDRWMQSPEILDPIRVLVPGMDDLLTQMLRSNVDERIASAVQVRKHLNQLRARSESRIPMHAWLDRIFDEEPPTGAFSMPMPVPGPTWKLPGFRAKSNETHVSGAPVLSATQTPPPNNAFFGRVALVDGLVTDFQQDVRVVCLKGPGGIGKTRIAHEVTRALKPHFMGGSWFVGLEQMSGRAQVLETIQSGLRVTGTQSRPEQMMEAIASMLAMRGDCLVILDAAESVVSEVQRMIEHWRQIAPKTRWLVTTRRAIPFSEGRLEEVGPLSESEAVALYQSRVQEGLKEGQTVPGRTSIQQMVDAVDCIPYAVELIAARVHETTPESLLQDLERSRSIQHIEIIKGIVGWSWRQLEPWERWVLAQLSVFRGGFFVEDAEELVRLSAWPDAPWVVHVLGSLLEKSLLTTQSTAVGPRFQMYRLIGAMAESALRSSGDALAEFILAPRTHPGSPEEQVLLRQLVVDQQRINARHGQIYGRLGMPRHEQALHRHGGLELWARHRLEGPNLEEAFERAMVSGRSQDASNLLIGLCILNKSTESQRDTMGRMERLLSQAALSKSGRARVLYHRANLLRRRGRLDSAHQQTKEVVEQARQIRSSSLLNRSKLTLSRFYSDQGDHDAAIALCRSVVQLAQQYGKGPLEVGARNHLAICLQSSGQVQEAYSEYQAALARAVEVGDVFHQATIQGNLAMVSGFLGLGDEARKAFQASITANRALGHSGGVAAAMTHLGHMEIELGNNEEAWRLLSEAHDIHIRTGRVSLLGQTLLGLGMICMNQDRLDTAKDYLARTLILARQRRSMRGQVLYGLFEAQRCWLSQEISTGLRVIEETVRLAQQMKWRHGEGVAWSMAGALELGRQNIDGARQRLEQASALLEAPHYEDHALLQVFWGHLALAEGAVQQAKEHHRQGHVLREKKGLGLKSSVGLGLARLDLAIRDA